MFSSVVKALIDRAQLRLFVLSCSVTTPLQALQKSGMQIGSAVDVPVGGGGGGGTGGGR